MCPLYEAIAVAFESGHGSSGYDLGGSDAGTTLRGHSSVDAAPYPLGLHTLVAHTYPLVTTTYPFVTNSPHNLIRTNRGDMAIVV